MKSSAARRAGAVPLQSVSLGIAASCLLLVLSLAVDAPRALLFLPLASAGLLAGSAVGLIWSGPDKSDRWKLGLFTVAMLIPGALMSAVVASQTSGGTHVMVLAGAVAFGTSLRITNERTVDLGGPTRG